jgi:hypothetical protein
MFAKAELPAEVDTKPQNFIQDHRDAFRIKRATLDLSHEAGKGVLFPTKPQCYILSTLSVSATNHMGYMSSRILFWDIHNTGFRSGIHDRVSNVT